MPFVDSEIQQIADRLRSISLEVKKLPNIQDIHTIPVGMEEAARRAEQLYLTRRRRDKVFESFDLFGEPSWDIMLDLLVMKVHGRRVGVTSSCIASACPSTTALRHIKRLEDHGLITVNDDPCDRRKRYMELTSTALDLLCTALA